MSELNFVLVGSSDDVLQGFNAGKHHCIMEISNTLLKAYVDLICTYHDTDVSYPDNLSGILFSVQDFGLMEKDNAN